MILKELKNISSRKLRVLCDLAVLPTCKPFRGAYPKRPVARDDNRLNETRRELLVSWWLPGDGPDTIEAKQAEFCT